MINNAYHRITNIKDLKITHTHTHPHTPTHTPHTPHTHTHPQNKLKSGGATGRPVTSGSAAYVS